MSDRTPSTSSSAASQTPAPADWQLNLEHLQTLCRNSSIGKQLPDAFYIHTSAISQLDPDLRAYESHARRVIAHEDFTPFNLVKFSKTKLAISYLAYPDFDRDPHPALAASIQIDLISHRITRRQYTNTTNPFILHRKETFIAEDYPHYQTFAALTTAEEQHGLLDNAREIGTRQNWEQRLQRQKLCIIDHQVTPIASISSTSKPHIDRHKAAIIRNALSKPVRMALEAQLFETGATFFDYGCGHGGDIDRIRQAGYQASGWDPYYCPDAPKHPASIVNLGYIINVIEDPAERRQALQGAWGLTESVAIVAAQVTVASDYLNAPIAYGDGLITQRNTFQKYFDQEELKEYIDTVLDVDAVPVALGIYFIFRDQSQAESFRASRFRSRTTTPRIRRIDRTFESYRELLTPLMAFLTERGRLPAPHELPESETITRELGSLRRAFRLIQHATDPNEWEKIAEQRRQEICMYLALSRFSKRPKFKQLSSYLQADIKALLGTYHAACDQADAMLFSLGDTTIIEQACRSSPLGQKQPNSLLIHVSAFDRLDPILRLYEGCASRTIGRMEEATLIKLHINSPKISYLDVPDFDINPHPAIRSVMTIDLRDLHVRYRDYDIEDPPILHRKDEAIASDYPFYNKFSKLSQQEKLWGLFDTSLYSSKHSQWQEILRNYCCQLQGHRLVWCKNANPQKLKLCQSEVRRKSKK
jgi:DNA phosphorothioation-associated putative methyltransferase